MPSQSARLRIFGWIALAIWLPLLLLQAFPQNQLPLSQSAFLASHTVLEIIAIAIAALVFFIAFGARETERSRRVVLLGCFFLITALLDTIHTLSYPGMPDIITANSTDKMIWFWLLARGAAGLGLLFYALQAQSPPISSRTRLQILLGSLLIFVLLSGLILAFPDALPAMHVPGKGLTPLKIGMEWLISGLYLFSALMLYRNRRRLGDYDVSTLIMALLLMAASELFFTVYVQVSSTANLIGHVYKVIAYYFLYRAIFTEAISRPFLQIEQLNKDLKYQRDFAAGIVNTAPIIILILDSQGRIQHANPYFEQLAGHRLDAIRGKDWFETFIRPDQRDAIRALFKHAIEAAPTRAYLNPILTAKGDERIIEWYDQVIYDDEGKVSSLLVVGQDVTERIRADEVLRQSEEHLKEAQALAHLGHWELDLRNGQASWSDETFRLLGLEPGSVTPSVEQFLQAVHPDDRLSVRAAIQRANRDADPDGRYQLEHRVVRPDGIHVLAQHGQLICDQSGEPVQVFGTSMDITERKQAEIALQRINDELEERVRQRTADMRSAKEEAEHANAAKSEFLSRMSHELRTPLNAILGFGQLLQNDPQQLLGEIQADNVQEILHAGQHLLELVNEVLDLSRIESGHIEVSLEAIAIPPMLEGCIKQLRPLAAKRDIAISLETLGDCAVLADHTRLRQVFINLLANAIKYNRDGGKIHIDCHIQDDGLAQVAFQDTGYGIPDAALPRLFKPFERLETAYHGIEGSGVGLALSKKLIEVMHGQIGVESVVDQGSRFWLRLPLAKLPSENTPPIAQATSAPVPVSERRYRVLYVEDNPANLRLVKKIIATRHDVDVLEASTAEQGLMIAREACPDLILLDINLPGMDGFAALQHLRSQPQTANIPVIAVTANAMPRDIKRGMAAGFDDYLTKPIDISRFLDMLEQQLRNTNRLG
ncbi:MAG: response regulator [Gammaproteobacteria bacterium]|nr:response regulator [Gammaproteobacteria bacterium]